MELLIEIIMELVSEGVSEASQSRKVPKPVRYIAILLIILFFSAVIGLIFLVGFMLLKGKNYGGIVFLLLGLFLVVRGIDLFRQTYMKKKNHQAEECSDSGNE